MEIGETFTGSSSEFDDSRFINYSCLALGKTATLTIKRAVKLEKGFKFQNGRTLDRAKLCLEFEKTDRLLRLNAGNRQMIERAFGTNTKEWVGKRVTIKGDVGVKFAGRAVGGVVITECLTKPAE